jgi:hypothetical protein
MNLRTATLFLILGSAYTVLHKLAYSLFPSLRFSETGRVITSILWLAATAALMLFAYQFLRELSPRNKWLRYSLVSVIVLTGIVIMSKLPFWSISEVGPSHRLLLGIVALCNSAAILAFLLSLARHVPRSSALWPPLRGSIWACSAKAALGLVSTGYFLVYLLTGQEVEPLPFLQPLAMLVFLLTYGMTIWFLIQFRRISNYADIVPR